MRRILSAVFLLSVSFALVTSSCKKKAYDEYYGRPDTLAPPIYQILQSKGNFKSLLACIDKAGYKDILSASGYWTMFAPNDAAFQKFFTDQGISGVDKIDSTTAQGIVTYALVYNAFTLARLNDYQANSGWVTNGAFRRRTANYVGVYDDTTYAGQVVKAIGANRNGSWVSGDNNNKYITYFTSTYFTAKGLPTTDYTYFFPNSTFSGNNVMAGAVVNGDIFAENGYIHEVDRVTLPTNSIDNYLGRTAQYSEFNKLLDKYIASFTYNSFATNQYKLVTGKNDNVYVKTFSSAFSPNNENYLKAADNDGQSNAFTLLAPRNDVLLKYIQDVVLEKYASLDVVPPQIINDLVNAQMWTTALWPSRFAITNNSQGEPPTISLSTDIIDKKVLSNGFLYGTSKVQEPNVFRTVYGRAYLDPAYLLMNRALDANYKFSVTIPTIKYTMIMMSDQVMKMRGYDYNTASSSWTYTQPGTSTVTSGSAPASAVQRILGTHIIPTPNGEMDNLSGSGIVETINGEYIKWNAGKLTSAGSQDSSYVVTTSNPKTSFNGRVYYADNLLTYSTKTIGARIKELGVATTSPFNYFYQYLLNNANYNATTGDIVNVQIGTFYTVFIPSNAAITQAVKDGILPGNVTTGVPNFAPTVASDIQLVNNFIYYHFLNKATVVPDGKKNGTYETLYKNASGDAVQITISNALNAMQIRDNKSRTSNVVVASSNNLADRCVIHLIDNYLKY